ncbi:MAG: dodecin domain-containing protein [Clostridia bacterium]|nr:dodecin domain-containing protein [Clostridia bacterium]
MSSKKHIKITGTSNISWKDAIVKTISEASETLQNLSTVVILEQRAKLQGDKIQEYYVDLDLEFEIDKNLQTLQETQSEFSNLDE